MSSARLTVVALVALALLTWIGILDAEEGGAPVDTVSGWVVDVNGWLDKGLIGIKSLSVNR